MATSDIRPEIVAEVYDTNNATIILTGSPRCLVKYHSNALAQMSAKEGHAPIDESLYIIRNGNNTGYGASHTFNNVESAVFTFLAEDMTGAVGTKTITLPMVNYVRLTCNIEDNRPDANGSMTVKCSGNYFNGSFGAESNTLTVQYRYKTQGSSYGQWQNMSITKNGNYYVATASLNIPNFDYQNTTCVFECRAIDQLETATSKESFAKNVPVFHWGENDFVFEVPVTFNEGLHNAKENQLLDLVYPVGSIVIRYDHLSPASIFGGVWTRVVHSAGGATFLYGCTAAGVIGECGGESTHTLTIDEMPQHDHNFVGDGSKIIQNDRQLFASGTAYSSRAGISVGADWSSNGSVVIGKTGGGLAHNNMPPYIKVSIWRRTA